MARALLVLPCASCLIRATCWANAPRWGGRQRCWLDALLPPPQVYLVGPAGMQAVTRVPLSFCLSGPRLVNAVYLQHKTNPTYCACNTMHKLYRCPSASPSTSAGPLRQLLAPATPVAPAGTGTKPTKFDGNRHQAIEATEPAFLNVTGPNEISVAVGAHFTGIGQGCPPYQPIEEIPN
jgi:hypothetical protein